MSSKLITIEEDPLNAATPLDILEAGLTPNRLFYVRNHFRTPALSPEEWRLSISGLVANPVEFSLQELKSFAPKEVTMLMECAGNARDQLDPAPPGTPWNHGAVSVAQFKGAPLTAVLERVQLKDQAVEILFEGADGGEVEPNRRVKYGRSLPLDYAQQPDILLAWEMNGEPLPPNHGYPLRLVVPGWYGMASVKWLTRIEALAEPFQGYFQHERYVYKADLDQASGPPVSRMKVRSLITSPAGGLELEVNQVEIRGLAWSGRGSIDKVEVSFDNGSTWRAAAVQPAASDYEPARWSYSWSPDAVGTYTVFCRAQDSTGDRQPLAYDWNALGYGNNGAHSVTVNIN